MLPLVPNNKLYKNVNLEKIRPVVQQIMMSQTILTVLTSAIRCVNARHVQFMFL